MNKQIRKYVTLSMMLAIAIVLNIVETQLTFFIPVPGAKLGLANIVTIIVLYAFGFPEAFIVAFLRVLIASLLMPGRFLSPSFFMALTGGLLSVLVMGLFKRINFFGVTGTSLFGSLAHVVGQVVVGYFLIGEGLLVYLPLMLVLGIITGFVIGLIARQFLKVSEGWLGSANKKNKIKEQPDSEETYIDKEDYKIEEDV